MHPFSLNKAFRRVISLVLAVNLCAHSVFAADPVVPAQEVSQVATVATDAQVPSFGNDAVKNVLGWFAGAEKFLTSAYHTAPDWLIYVGLIGGIGIIGELLRKHLLPQVGSFFSSLAKIWNSGAAYKVGQQVQEKLEPINKKEYQPSVIERQQTSGELEDILKQLLTESKEHEMEKFNEAVKKIKKKTEHITDLQRMRLFSHDPEIRKQISESGEFGKKLIEEYDRAYLKDREAWDTMKKSSDKTNEIALQFYQSLKKIAGPGWTQLSIRGLTPFGEREIEEPIFGKIGEVSYINSDKTVETFERSETKLTYAMLTVQTECITHFRELELRRKESVVEAKKFFGKSVGGVGAVGALGWLVGQQSAKIEQSTGEKPADLINNQQKVEAADSAKKTAQKVAESFSPGKVREDIHAWRTSSKGSGQKVFDILRDEFNKSIPEMTASIQKQMGNKVERQLFEKGLKNLESAEFVDQALESSLADAMTDPRLKLADSSQIEAVLLAEKGVLELSQREQLLTFQFGLLPKFIWMDSITNPADYPLDAKFVLKYRNGVKERLAELHEAQRHTTEAAPQEAPKKEVSHNKETKDFVFPMPVVGTSLTSP